MSKQEVDWTNEIFPLLFRHLAAIERKKRFGLVKIELVAELIHTKSVVLGTNPSRAYKGESYSRLLPGMKELDGRPFPGKRKSSDRKAQLSLSRDLSLAYWISCLTLLLYRITGLLAQERGREGEGV